MKKLTTYTEFLNESKLEEKFATGRRVTMGSLEAAMKFMSKRTGIKKIYQKQKGDKFNLLDDAMGKIIALFDPNKNTLTYGDAHVNETIVTEEERRYVEFIKEYGEDKIREDVDAFVKKLIQNEFSEDSIANAREVYESVNEGFKSREEVIDAIQKFRGKDPDAHGFNNTKTNKSNEKRWTLNRLLGHFALLKKQKKNKTGEFNESLDEAKSPLKLKVFVKEGEVTTIEIANADLYEEDDEDDETQALDIDIELEDETGKTLDDDEEEEGKVEEKARPPRQTPRQRKANQVKGEATRNVLGPDSPLRGKIEKMFQLVKREIKKVAREKGVPVSGINLDSINIKA